MTNQTSIQYISGLLNNPASITDGDQSSIALFRQTFPYFIPVRYLAALENHKKEPFTPEMLSEVRPYIGNWMLFCDFLDYGTNEKSQAGGPNITREKEQDVTEAILPFINKVTDKKSLELQGSTQQQEKQNRKQKRDALPNLQEPGKPSLSVTNENVVTDKLLNEEAGKNEPKNNGDHYQEEKTKNESHSSVVPGKVIVEENWEEEKLNLISQDNKEKKRDTKNTEKKEVNSFDIVPEKVVADVAENSGDRDIASNIISEPKEETILTEESISTAAPVMPVQENVIKEINPKSNAATAATLPQEPNTAQNANPEKELTNEKELTQPLTNDAIATKTPNSKEEELIQPVYTSDYFLQQGIRVPKDIPADIDHLKAITERDKALMIMMSFSEWLLHFKNTSEKQKEEIKDQKSLKTMWQKEKLAAAMEEENEEIPENVFEMAVNSIAKEDGLASESLADIYMKQKKYDKAIEMYRKLSLKYPKKNAYFARKIEEVLKEKQS